MLGSAGRGLRRMVGLLPSGTIAVGAGLAVLGVASYVYLAIVGHAVGSADYSKLSILWAIVFSAGLGLFFPIEQEVTRIVAARAVTGDGSTPVFRRGAALAGGLLLVACAALAATASPLAHRLFDGDRSLVLALAGGLLGLAVAHPTRGVLAGTGRFGGYGVQLGVDGALRMVLAGGLGLAHVRSPLPYALILTVAPVVSVLATARPIRAGMAAGTPLPASAFARGVAPLMLSTLLAQVVVNIAVIDVKLLAPTETVLAGALLSALVLARVPLFVFASLQASLLPGLSAAAAGGDPRGFRRLLLRGCAIVTVLAVGAGLPTVVLGPWLLRVLFAVRGSLGGLDFAVLAAGTGVYLLAQVLGQGAMARNRHQDQALAWICGTVALVGVTLVPGDVRLRVEAGYAIGSLVVALVLAATLVLRSPGGDGRSTEPAPAALVALGGGD
jgi:O-antigen/teichoic acid export membrane protein